MSEPRVVAGDGVAVATVGDTVVVLWSQPARAERTRWVWQRVEAHARSLATPLRAVLLVLPTSTPPDAAGRAENAAGFERIGDKLGRITVVPLGDDLWLMLVRTVMRGMFFLQRSATQMKVAATTDEGLRRVLEEPVAATPSRGLLGRAVRELYASLGLEAP